MWVTQTYLGDVERDAKAFVYYCLEDYVPEQKQLTEAIQAQLEKLGKVYGDKVSLLMPNPNNADQIERELRRFGRLWEAIQNHLPGLLVLPTPLNRLTASYEGCSFVPLKNGTPEHLANVIRNVRRLADEKADTQGSLKAERPSWLRNLADAFEVKPGIWGIRLDLRKLMKPAQPSG